MDRGTGMRNPRRFRQHVLAGLAISLVVWGQVGSAAATFSQSNAFASYPPCTQVPFLSTSGWRPVSFERLSIHLPDRLQVSSEPFGFDHGGQLWKGDSIEVSIAKFMGVSVEPYRPSASLANVQCTTDLGGAFALIREHAVNGIYTVSALFPELGLGLEARSARVGDLALLRAVVGSARPTSRAVP